MTDDLPFIDSHAFIIGINDYQHVSPLKTAVNDAKALAHRLESQHKYTIHGPLLNPTKEELKDLFEQTIPQTVKEEDRVIFYFAGHGIALDSDEGPNGYIVPADARQGDRESLVPMDVFHKTLKELPCKHGLLILDCCFSGAFKWSTGKRDIIFDLPKVIYNERFQRYLIEDAWQVITSSAHDQKAVDVVQNQTVGMREEGEGSHSPFAKALFEAIDGAGDVIPAGEEDGVITASELYAYLRDSVPRQTEGEGGKPQIPSMFHLDKHGKGEFIFLNPRHPLNLKDTPVENPFRGLNSYDKDHHPFFFGRDRVIEALLEKVRNHQLTVVSGASGTGKSSVMKAGVLPALEDEGWHLMDVIRPGKEPLLVLEELIGDLPEKIKENKKHLIVIDQYEELITQCEDPADREAFEEKLADCLRSYENLHVILSVRSDFEGQFDSQSLGEWWEQGRYIVPAFTLEEYREVITRPALQAVLFYEPIDLVDRLVEEVSQAPGALPLLSFTLSEMFHKQVGRRDRTLTEEDYEELGGVIGALKSQADRVYLAQDAAHQDTMERLMLRMVSLEGGELARKRVYAEELEYELPEETARMQAVADQLIEARLILSDKDNQGKIYLEPAHDALVRAWARLWGWIKKIREEKITLLDRLTRSVHEYQALKESASKNAGKELWHSNPRLGLVTAFKKKHPLSLNAAESTFVRKSVNKKRWINAAWIAGLAAVFIALSLLTRWALNERDSAELHASNAEKQAIKADSSAKVAKHQESVALINADSANWASIRALHQQILAEEHADSADRATLFALQQQGIAVRNADSARRAEKKAVFQREIADSMRGVADQNAREATEQKDIAEEEALLSHTAELAAKSREIYDKDNTLALYYALEAYHTRPTEEAVSALSEVLTNDQSSYYESILPHGEIIVNADISSHKANPLMLTASEKSIKLWKPDGELLIALDSFPGTIVDAIFTPDGKHILAAVTAGRNGYNAIMMMDLKGNLIRSFEGFPAQLRQIDCKENILVAGCFDYSFHVFDLHQPDHIVFSQEIPKWLAKKKEDPNINGTGPHSFTLSQDGQYLLRSIGDQGGSSIELWSTKDNPSLGLKTGKKVREFNMMDEILKQLNPLFRDQTTSQVTWASISPDGQRIIGGSWQYGAQVWNPKGKKTLFLPPSEALLTKVQIFPDSIYNSNYKVNGSKGWYYSRAYMLMYETDGRAVLFDKQGKKFATFRDAYIKDLVLSPNRKYLLTAGNDGRAKVYDVARNIGRPLWKSQSGGRRNFLVQRFPNKAGQAFVFHPNGEQILIGKHLHQIEKEEMRNMKLPPKGISSFFPGGDTLLVSKGNTVLMWDMQRDILLDSLVGHSQPITALAISANGKRILTGDRDGLAILWNHEGHPLDTMLSHSKAINALSFTPTGDSCLSASADNTVYLWGGTEQRISLKFPFPVRSVTISKDGTFAWIAAGNRDVGMVQQWNIKANTNDPFSPINTYSVSALADGQHLMWYEKELKQGGYKLVLFNLPFRKRMLEIETDEIPAISPDGKYIATREMGRVNIWMNPVANKDTGPYIHALTDKEKEQFGLK